VTSAQHSTNVSSSILQPSKNVQNIAKRNKNQYKPRRKINNTVHHFLTEKDIKKEIADIVGLPVDQIDPDRTLTELGTGATTDLFTSLIFIIEHKRFFARS
jgi:hypothetical protein